jgi:hypothetical protein
VIVLSIVCFLLSFALGTTPLNTYAFSGDSEDKQINIIDKMGVTGTNNYITGMGNTQAFSILLDLRTKIYIPSTIGEYFTLTTNEEELSFELGISDTEWYAKIGENISISGADRFRLLPNTEYHVLLVYDNETKSGRLIIEDAVFIYNETFKGTADSENKSFRPSEYWYSNKGIFVEEIGLYEGFIPLSKYEEWAGITVTEGRNKYKLNTKYIRQKDEYLKTMRNRETYEENLTEFANRKLQEEAERISPGTEFEVVSSKVDVSDGINKVYSLYKGETFSIVQDIVVRGMILVEYSKGMQGFIQYKDIEYGSKIISTDWEKHNYHGHIFSDILSGNLMDKWMEQVSYTTEQIISQVPFLQKNSIISKVIIQLVILIAFPFILFLFITVLFAFIKKRFIGEGKLSKDIIVKTVKDNTTLNRWSFHKKIDKVILSFLSGDFKSSKYSEIWGGFSIGFLFVGSIFTIIYDLKTAAFNSLQYNIEADYFFHNMKEMINPFSFVTIPQFVLYGVCVLALVIVIFNIIGCVQWGKYCKPIDGIWMGICFINGLLKSIFVNSTFLGFIYLVENIMATAKQYFIQ